MTGGIGITPMRSMLRYIKAKKLDYNIVLLYANGNVAEIIFRDELDELAASHSSLRVEHVLSGPDITPDWKGKTGPISKDSVIDVVPDYRERWFYISGTPRTVMACMEQTTAPVS